MIKKGILFIIASVLFVSTALSSTALAQTKLYESFISLTEENQNTQFTVRAYQYGNERVQIDLDFLDIGRSISQIGVGEYLGESGTNQRVLIGDASQVSEFKWAFNWNIRNVNEGKHRLFLILKMPETVLRDDAVGTTLAPEKQIETKEFVINIQKTDVPAPTTSATTSQPPTNTPTTDPIQSITDNTLQNINTLSDLITTTFTDVNESAESTVAGTEEAITQISTSIKGSASSEEEVSKIETETDLVTKEITDSITTAQQVIRVQVLSGKDTTQTKETLRATTEESLNKLETLADEFKAAIDISDLQDKILDDLSLYEEEIQMKKDAFEARGGLSLYLDSDDDGVSDYDEEYIYNTDVNNRDSDADGKTDGDEILSGFNPTASGDERIAYEDVRVIQNVTKVFSVEDIIVTETVRVDDVDQAKKIKFTGRALPNSFITLYIYSSPITVTVKADVEGNWEYTLDQELTDGSHEVYVATVDNTGKVLARSEGVPFVKQAAAIELVDFATVANEPTLVNPAFIAGGIIVLILIIIVTFLVIGHFNRKRDEELKKMSGGDVNTPHI